MRENRKRVIERDRYIMSLREKERERGVARINNCWCGVFLSSFSGRPTHQSHTTTVPPYLYIYYTLCTLKTLYNVPTIPLKRTLCTLHPSERCTSLRVHSEETKYRAQDIRRWRVAITIHNFIYIGFPVLSLFSYFNLSVTLSISLFFILSSSLFYLKLASNHPP